MKSGFEKFKKRVGEGTRGHERSRRVKVSVAKGYGPGHAENALEGEEVEPLALRSPKGEAVLKLAGGSGDVPQGSFASAGQQYGVDPNLLRAIFQFETGGGTSGAWQHRNNPGGLGGGGTHFESPQAGIDAMARNLKTNYIDKGLTTIGQIGAKWAPPGASNDPHGTNAQWPGAVTKLYKAATGQGYGGGGGTFKKGYGVGEPLRDVAPATRRAKGPYRDLSTPTGPLGMGTQFFETPESEFPRATPAPAWGGETPGWFRPGLAQGEAPRGQVSQPTYWSGGIEYAPTTDPKNPGYVALGGPNQGQVVTSLPGHPTPTPAPAEPAQGGGAEVPPNFDQYGRPTFEGWTAGPGGQNLAYQTNSYYDPQYGWVPHAQLANAQASNNPLDYFNPFGNTSKGGSGTGGPTQRGVGMAVGTVSNLLLPGSGFITGPLSRYLTSLVQKQHPNATPQQVQRIVQTRLPPMPSGSVPLPTHGGGYDPGAGVDPYGNPTRGREWYSSDFGRGLGGPDTTGNIGNLGSYGSGAGGGFYGHTVRNFGTAIGFGGNLGGDAVVNAGALGGGALNRNLMGKLAAGQPVGSPGGYANQSAVFSPWQLKQAPMSGPATGPPQIVNPAALYQATTAQQSRHIGQRQEQQKGTAEVQQFTEKELRDMPPWLRDILLTTPKYPKATKPGEEADPKMVPVFQGPQGRYYDPDFSPEEDLQLMAKKGKSTVQYNRGAKQPNTDTVPAMLTPREAVLNRNAAELAGRGNIEQLNQQGNQLAEQGVDLAGGKNMKPKKMQTGGNVTNQPAKPKNPAQPYDWSKGAWADRPAPNQPAPLPVPQWGGIARGSTPPMPETPMVGLGSLGGIPGGPTGRPAPYPNWGAPAPGGPSGRPAPYPWGAPPPPVTSRGANPFAPGGGAPVPGGFYPPGRGIRYDQAGTTNVQGVDPIADLGGGGTAYGAPVQLSAGDVSKFQKAAQQAGLNQNQIAGIMQALKGIGGAYGAATGGGGALYGSGGGEISPLTAAGGFQGGISDIGYPPFVAPTAEYHADNSSWRGPYDPRYFLTGY